MSRWWRAYDEAMDDPKLLLLSDRAHRAWFNLMCLASASGGRLPERKIIEIKLRLSPSKTEAVMKELVAAGLIDQDEEGLKPHNWNGRQYKSDVSTERVKRFRNAQRNVSETPPETETDTERKERIKRADARGGDYAFMGGVVRLSRRHFADWTKAFPSLDLLAELTARDAWLGSPKATDEDRKNWFISTSKYLANRNLEAKSRVTALRPDAPRGIPGIV